MSKGSQDMRPLDGWELFSKIFRIPYYSNCRYSDTIQGTVLCNAVDSDHPHIEVTPTHNGAYDDSENLG